jgi:hypothetical protein
VAAKKIVVILNSIFKQPLTKNNKRMAETGGYMTAGLIAKWWNDWIVKLQRGKIILSAKMRHQRKQFGL